MILLELYILQIVDPYLASYGAGNPIFAVIQLAQTTMRSELGKMTLDKTFEERDALNDNIVVCCHLSSNLEFSVKCFHLLIFFLQRSINEAASDWGLKCLRYEISMCLIFFFIFEYDESHKIS
jgi:hypothetical protein